MTSTPSNSPQSGTPQKNKWALDAGWATFLAAIVGAIALVTVAVLGTLKASNSPSVSPARASTTKSELPSVAISEPPAGKIQRMQTYSGTAVNLEPGQLVWTFNQAVSSDGTVNQKVYPDTGPCSVDYAHQTWKCVNVFVGNQVDHNTYRICAAPLDAAEAYEIVDRLRHSYEKNFTWWFATPPSYIHDDTSACMSASRI